MKKFFKKILVFGMILSVVSVTEGAVTAGAKKISSFSAAKKAALKKVPSATIKEIDTDMENGRLVYDVELYKKNKEYSLKYRASDGKLMEYGWEIMHPSVTNQNKKNLSRKTIKKKALKQVNPFRAFENISDFMFCGNCVFTASPDTPYLRQLPVLSLLSQGRRQPSLPVRTVLR